MKTLDTLTTDLTVHFGDFHTTTATVEATSEKGKTLLTETFGAGAVSANFPKSKVEDFLVFAGRKGLTWS